MINIYNYHFSINIQDIYKHYFERNILLKYIYKKLDISNKQVLTLMSLLYDILKSYYCKICITYKKFDLSFYLRSKK